MVQFVTYDLLDRIRVSVSMMADTTVSYTKSSLNEILSLLSGSGKWRF